VSAVALVVFVALVAYVAVTKRDVQNRRAERGGRGPSHLHMPHTHLEGAPRPQAAES
jgi:hypothetical protein